MSTQDNKNRYPVKLGNLIKSNQEVFIFPFFAVLKSIEKCKQKMISFGNQSP